MPPLDDYLTYGSPSAFILVLSQYKYSLETSITRLNNRWVRINCRKKSENIIRTIEKKRGFPSGWFQAHLRARKQGYQQRRVRVQSPGSVLGAGPGSRRRALPGCQSKWQKLLLSLHHHQEQQPVYYSLQQPSDLLANRTGTAGAGRGRGRDFTQRQ